MNWKKQDIRRIKDKGLTVSNAAKAQVFVPGNVTKGRSREESELQSKCVADFRMIFPEYAMLYFSIPNGGLRDAATAKIIVNEGALAGVWDTLLLIPRKEFHGTFIEFKTDKGKLSLDQTLFRIAAESKMYFCQVVRSEWEFWVFVKWWLNTERIDLKNYSKTQ